MTAYLVFIAVLTLLFLIDYSSKKDGYGVYTLIGLFLIIIFASLRHEVGFDYLNYQYFFSDAQTDYLWDSGMEPGFVLSIALPKALELDYTWTFAAFSIATYLLLFRAIKLYTSNVRIAILVFVLTPGLFLNSLSILRQSLAIVLVFNAYFYLFEKNFLKFWLLVLLATSFHYSALLVIPFYWLATKLEKYAWWFVVLGVPFSLILAKMNFIGILAGAVLGGSSKFLGYLNSEDAGTGLLKLVVLNVSIVPYLVFYKRMDSLNRSLLVLLTIGLMMTNVFASIGAITRIAYYFKIFEMVLLGNLLTYFKAGLNRVLMCLLIFCYFFLMFYTSLSFDYNEVVEYPKITPYKTIFER